MKERIIKQNIIEDLTTRQYKTNPFLPFDIDFYGSGLQQFKTNPRNHFPEKSHHQNQNFSNGRVVAVIHSIS